jgi:hypothetical protein
VSSNAYPRFRPGEMNTTRLAQSWADLPTVFRSLGAVQCEIWAGPGVKRRAQITGCSPVVRLIEPSKDQDGDD